MNLLNWFRGKIRLRTPKVHEVYLHTPTQKAEDEYLEIAWRESVQRRVRKTQAEKDRLRILQ